VTKLHGQRPCRASRRISQCIKLIFQEQHQLATIDTRLTWARGAEMSSWVPQTSEIASDGVLAPSLSIVIHPCYTLLTTGYKPVFNTCMHYDFWQSLCHCCYAGFVQRVCRARIKSLDQMSGLIDYPADRETLTKQTTACNLSADGTPLHWSTPQETQVLLHFYTTIIM